MSAIERRPLLAIGPSSACGPWLTYALVLELPASES